MDKGLINLEINKILQGEAGRLYNEFSLFVHTPAADIPIKLFVSAEWISNYYQNLADYIIVTFKITAGVYIKQIYANNDQLEATLIRSPKDGGPGVRRMRYKMVLLDSISGIEGTHYNKMTEDELDKYGIFTIQAQLVQREFEALRAVSFGGVFKDTTVETAIKVAFSIIQEQYVKVSNKKLTLYQDMTPAANTNVYKQVVVPSGMKLLDYPGWLQQAPNYGVYNGYIGTYYAPMFPAAKSSRDPLNMIYVYPLFRTGEDNEKIQLQIFQANSDKYNMVDQTYTKDGNIIKILATIKHVKIIDQGANKLISNTTGVIHNNAASVMTRKFSVTNEALMFDKSTRLEGVSVANRRDTVETNMYKGIGDNTFAQRSAQLSMTFSFYQIKWPYCNSEYFRPGMPATFIYEDEKYGITKLHGVLHMVYNYYDAVLKHEICELLIAVENPTIYYGEKRAEIDKKLAK